MVCGGVTVSRSALLFSSIVYVLCHSIVGLGLRLCDRVVLSWGRGDGCVGWKGVWCLLSVLYACGVCVVLLCCGMAGGSLFVSLFPLLSSLFLPFPLCVGVRGSARAALRARTLSPNTTVLPCCLVFSCLSSPLPAFLHAPPFLLLWNGGV